MVTLHDRTSQPNEQGLDDPREDGWANGVKASPRHQADGGFALELALREPRLGVALGLLSGAAMEVEGGIEGVPEAPVALGVWSAAAAASAHCWEEKGATVVKHRGPGKCVGFGGIS